MAKRTTVTLVDDLDGTVADESVAFGVDGSIYEIDLSDANAAALRDAVPPYVASARRLGGRRLAGADAASKSNSIRLDTTSSSSRSTDVGAPKRSPEENQTIRAWAVEHGAFVPAR